MIINEIRNQLLEEAKSSPNLLADLAGLETYIAESYNNRSFIELLQNADDANATKFKIIKDNNFLYVANNGRFFNASDIESLCRSASSNKIRGKNIGYRGIGFKSVVSFAKEIHIISGDLEITFSKERTKNEIINATRVPLIRIPHSIHQDDKSLIAENVGNLLNVGFTTIFIFTGITSVEIESEYDSFDYKSLLFLKNITTTEILISNYISTYIEKEIISEHKTKLKIENNENQSEWLVSTYNNTSIAFQIENNLPTRINLVDAFVYSFLPTEDITGLGVIVNGDFSTDPSRKHLIYDIETNATIKNIASQIINIIEENLGGNKLENNNIIKCLVPYADPRMMSFKKTSFEKILLEEVKNIDPAFFEKLLLPPNWLNAKDYNVIAKTINNLVVDSNFLNIDGLLSFLKFLGAKEASFDSLKKNINNSDISTFGCVQISKYIFVSILSISNDNFILEVSDLKILIHNKKRYSFKQVLSEKLLIDDSYISLLIENGLTEFDIKQAFKKLLPNYSGNLVLEKKDNDIMLNSFIQNVNIPTDNWYNNSKEISTDRIKYAIKRWRTAEEITLEILNLNGFNLQDVSKQNIGYDLDGFDPNGEEIHIEVKSITLPGQKFKLTNNEIGVAQAKPQKFYVAIVRQTDDFFEIAMISDPIKNLILNRQCMQWIWECSEYEYNPRRFAL
ncbi:hypothetical protein DMB65_05915 [Flavobacterium cheongpyeongense]|uniref:Protein NO VEIN C-terminal domain-containing protein n=1 Tax=Flavobacterium cheongpyeongense TaxID=2212651 RepID=A0A2V4BS82_9FLAO|nr:DUF3883 domain-containing protein [Flavobacterium cheongpyeongense]PXY41487.1 hypothetical protein DMB65_05915 [Flavobacterium cheongpyeongense]